MNLTLSNILRQTFSYHGQYYGNCDAFAEYKELLIIKKHCVTKIALNVVVCKTYMHMAESIASMDNYLLNLVTFKPHVTKFKYVKNINTNLLSDTYNNEFRK